MVDLVSGCVLERLPPLTARKALRYFEYAPRAPLPTFSTLARFRKQWGPDVQVALVCPKSSWTTPKGPFRAGPELDEGIKWVLKVADILAAFAIVVAPGAELTPGARDSQLLAAFVARLKPSGRTVVVAPRGLWEAESAAAFAEEHGCLYGFDPMEDDAPAGPIAYARVRPMGARPRLTDGHLLQILERSRVGRCDKLFISIEAEDAYRAVKRLQSVSAELGEALDEEPEEEDSDEEDSDEEDSDEEETEGDEADGDDADRDDADGDDEGDEDEGDEDEGEDDDLDDEDDEDSASSR